MKKGIKGVLLFALAVIVGAVVVAGLIFYLFGQQAIRVGVEGAATKALGVGVGIGELKLSILKGAVGIEGLEVRNPPGYTFENLLELKNGRVQVDIWSLLSDTVQIKEIKLQGLNLTIEQKVLSNNLQDVIKSLPAKEKRAGEPAGKKLHIGELEISDITVKVKMLPIPGKSDTVTLKIDPIRMSNLGTDRKLDTAQLTSKIMLALASGVAKQGAGVLPEEMVTGVKSTLGQTLELGKQAGEEGVKIIEKGKDIGTGVIKGVTDLLKAKEEKQR